MNRGVRSPRSVRHMPDGGHPATHPKFGASAVRRGTAELVVACLLIAVAACARAVVPTPILPPATPSPTSRSRPTSTTTPGPTSTRRATATSTLGPAPTLTPWLTPTPQLSPGPDPRILFFAATPDSGLEIGDEVLLSWEARGERAELSWYDHYGQIEGWRKVPLSGSTTVQLWDGDPVADHWVDFKLYVLRESGIYSYTERRLRVTLVCRLEWFFSPAPGGCPSEAPERIFLVGQRFEGGVVLGDATHARVYLDEPGQPYVSLGLRLLPQADMSDAAPPAGLFPPAPEFSGVWAGLLPGHEDLRDRLGWAMGPAVGFDSARQCAQAEAGGPPWDCFQLGMVGQVYHARMAGEPEAIWLDDKWPLSYSTGTWELWPIAGLDDG